MERTKKIGVEVLLKSQRFDNKVDQNKQILVYFCSLIIVLNKFIAKNN